MRCSKIIALFLLLGVFTQCTEEDSTDHFPFILFKQGEGFVKDGDRIPVGGQMQFGLEAVGGGGAITYIRVKRITGTAIVTELDKGIFIATGGLDTVLTFPKGPSEAETWNFFIMNEFRDTASVYLDIFLGDGSAYGEINHYPSILLSYPTNSLYGHFLDLDSGRTYTKANISGREAEIDLAAFFYYTSGNPSPTLTCPGYTSAQTHYPVFATWTVKNNTTYDYYSTDNDLVAPENFDSALNDSLLVAGYRPQNVSGLCKYCYTGKIIPFKTAGGKYGMIKVIRADETGDGTMEIGVKIQQ